MRRPIRHGFIAALLTALAAVTATAALGGAPTAQAGDAGRPALAPGVYFQDDGTLGNWDRAYAQKDGVMRVVTKPTYKGSAALEAKQQYIDEDGGYHSETIKRTTQKVGEDRYYGQAIYLPPNWRFHNQNVTFQQWSPEKPEGPWVLMFVQDDDIRFGGSGGLSGSVRSIASLRGTWIRIVVRLEFAKSNGALEVWVNGRKEYSRSGTVLPKTAKTVRWSSGIYCTGWRAHKPSGQRVLSIFHDHARVASSYNLAEPANW